MNHLVALLCSTVAFSIMLTAPVAIGAEKDESGFVSMFDGKTLQGCLLYTSPSPRD